MAVLPHGERPSARTALGRQGWQVGPRVPRQRLHVGVHAITVPSERRRSFRHPFHARARAPGGDIGAASGSDRDVTTIAGEGRARRSDA
ncbi:hypothetical protein DWX12_10175 [Bifidobacterium pseudocatenulatum]|nr:hypothetical protein DWX12_10175 [Bifidobacterium pseudocatenulatum]